MDSPFFCSTSPDGRHNFAVAGGDCFNGCGANQAAMSGSRKKTVTVSALFKGAAQPRKKNTRIHSELHELVAQLRRDFGETATKGKGSFSFYLGMLKRVPISMIRVWHSDIMSSDNLVTPLARCKVFWWAYREYCKPIVNTANQLNSVAEKHAA